MRHVCGVSCFGGSSFARRAALLVCIVFTGALGCSSRVSSSTNGDTDDATGDGDDISTSSGCGNDERRGYEECDGTDLGGATCVSAGYEGGTLGCTATCTYDATGCTGAGPSCGDGAATGFEQCDGDDLLDGSCAALGYDGGTLACAADCRYDTTACTGPAPVCGDQTAEGLEQCDGADLREQACTDFGFASGQLECDETCQIVTGGCTNTSSPVCGDGVAEGSEACDGDDFKDASCASLGFQGGQLGCTTSCEINTVFCFGSSATCGDGEAEGPEPCDGSDLNGQSCESLGYDGGELVCDACSFDVAGCSGDGPTCGDGVLEGTEQCDGDELGDMTCEDFGFSGGELTCSDTCEYRFISCTMFQNVCGDDAADAFELCDGDDVRGANCEQLGAGSGTLTCNTTCDGYDLSGCSAAPTCGDGSITGNEVCDGSSLGVLTSCTLAGYGGGGPVTCMATCLMHDLSACTNPPPICNGVMALGMEQCDGGDLRGKTCESLGFSSGQLACNTNCSFDVSNCVP